MRIPRTAKFVRRMGRGWPSTSALQPTYHASVRTSTLGRPGQHPDGAPLPGRRIITRRLATFHDRFRLQVAARLVDPPQRLCRTRHADATREVGAGNGTPVLD